MPAVSATATTPTIAAADSKKPPQSNGPGCVPFSGGTQRITAAMPSRPIGMLRLKIHGQSATLSTKPASGGPISGPTSAGMVNQAMPRIRCSFGVELTTISRATGVIIAPPMPWTIRAPTSSGSVRESPQSAEPARKTSIAVMNTRRAPNRSAAQPLMGMNTASARM